MLLHQNQIRKDRLRLEGLESRTLLAGDLLTAAIDSTMSSDAEIGSTATSADVISHTSADAGINGLFNTQLIDNLLNTVQSVVHSVGSSLTEVPGGDRLQSLVDGVVAKAIDQIRSVEHVLTNGNLEGNLGANVGGDLSLNLHPDAVDLGLNALLELDPHTLFGNSSHDLGNAFANTSSNSSVTGSMTTDMAADATFSSEAGGVNANSADNLATGLNAQMVADQNAASADAQASGSGASLFSITPGTPVQPIDPAAVIAAVNDRSVPGSLEGVRDGIGIDRQRWTVGV